MFSREKDTMKEATIINSLYREMCYGTILLLLPFVSTHILCEWSYKYKNLLKIIYSLGIYKMCLNLTNFNNVNLKKGLNLF